MTWIDWFAIVGLTIALGGLYLIYLAISIANNVMRGGR